MCKLLLTIAVCSLRLPNVETFEDYKWQPKFTAPTDLMLQASTVAFVTHASRHFDPLGITQPAVISVTEQVKVAGLPVVYLHDQNNSKNPAWMYLYRDRNPTAFLSSDVGHFDIDFSAIRHLISIGGYFGQCQRSTVEDALRCWRRDAPDHDFRVTQVVDGIFCVSEFIRFNDPFERPIREWHYGHLKKLHPDAANSVWHNLRCIESTDLQFEFLCRQIPEIPPDINIVLDLFGETETVQVAQANDAPTLTLAWRKAEQFLEYEPTEPDRTEVSSRALRRRRYPSRTRR